MDYLYSSNSEYYIKHQNDPAYFAKYKRECERMQRLYDMDREQYCSLFPRYYSYSNNSGKPSVTMERISGITLEERLKKKPILSNSNIVHIFSQIDQAQKMLQKVNMLQLDLNPKNILVINSEFDIRLIDLTEACYLDDSNYNRCRRVDVSASPDIAISLQLREAGALLFCRLFYKGNEDYFKNRSQTNRLRKYSELLQCLDSKSHYSYDDYDNDPLFYWNAWMQQFKILFDRYR